MTYITVLIYYSANGAESSEDLVARLTSHKDIKNGELDLLATSQLTSSEGAPAHPIQDDAVSQEKQHLIGHLGLKSTPNRYISHMYPFPGLFLLSLLQSLHVVQNADFRVVVERSNWVIYALPYIQE